MVPEDSEGIQEPSSAVAIKPDWMNNTWVNVILILIPLIAFLTSLLRINMGGIPWTVITLTILTLSVTRFISGSSLGISERGIYVPDMWFTRRFIPWSEIVSVDIFDEDKTIILKLDTTWNRIVRTGLSDVQIVIDEGSFVIDDFDTLSMTINRYWNMGKRTPDTLNERITRQVETAWANRYKQWLVDFLDDFSFGIFLLLEIDLVIYVLSNSSMFPLGYLILIPVLLLFALFATYDVPDNIIAIRPHELGALLYDDEDVVTSIRFIVYAQPNPINLHSCDITYSQEQEHQQVTRFIQIHPAKVKPGELTYGVGQVTGNHQKADGAKISFSVGNSEKIHTIDLVW